MALLQSLFLVSEIVILLKLRFVNNYVVELRYDGSHVGNARTSGVIQSPNFTHEYVLNNTVYVYYINNTAHGYVQLVLTDLRLKSASSLKIYDGWNTSAASYVFPYASRNRGLPVFQSKTHCLMVVFKTGAGRKYETYKGGFNAKYKFVSYARKHWVDQIPSTGFCPRISASQGRLLVSGAQVTYNFHCVWLLAPTFNWRSYGIRIFNVSFSSGETVFKIHNGLTSLSSLALSLRMDNSGRLQTQKGQEAVFPTHLNGNNFYISLEGPMTADDYVYLAFSDIYSAWKTMSSIERLPMYSSSSVCPFKTSVRSPDRCLNYWESEKKDGSCDVYSLQLSCTNCMCLINSDKCFSPQRDRCDGFNDCGDNTDETKCRFGYREVDGWRVLILILGAATILFILRDFRKNRRRIGRDCRGWECSRTCWQNMWNNLWKDSAFTHYLRKCPLCRTCMQSSTSEEEGAPGSARASHRTGTSVVAVIPVTTTTVLHSGRRRGRGRTGRTYFYPATAPAPPAYSEHDELATRDPSNPCPQYDSTSPPSYEETIAATGTEQPIVLPTEPPPAYEPAETHGRTREATDSHGVG